MREQHARELKVRDEKIAFLKKQIGDSLKDNSWYETRCTAHFLSICERFFRERQQHIEELTKQLKRTHEEYEMLRQKLVQYQSKKGVRRSRCAVIFIVCASSF